MIITVYLAGKFYPEVKGKVVNIMPLGNSLILSDTDTNKLILSAAGKSCELFYSKRVDGDLLAEQIELVTKKLYE